MTPQSWKGTPSKAVSRGELEISDLNQMYLDDGHLKVELMGRRWLAGHRHLRRPQRRQWLHPHAGTSPGPKGGLSGGGGLASGLDHF